MFSLKSLKFQIMRGIIRPIMGMPAFRTSRWNLGVKLSVFVVALVLVVSASMAYFLVYRSAADRRVAAESRIESLARILGGIRIQGYGGRQYDPMVIRMFVELGEQLGTNLCFVVFSRPDSTIEDGAVNLSLLDEAAPALAGSLEKLSAAERLARIQEWRWNDEHVRPFRLRLKNQRGEALGTALLGFSTIELEQQIRESMLANLLVTAGAFLVGLVGALFLARGFTRPIREVAQAMRGVSEGRLDQTLAVRSRDEVGVLAQSFNVMAEGLRERERIRSTLARYVSDQVAERILREEDEVSLEGELRRVTVLFLDIRGFTTLAEYLRPHEVVSLLNDYFGIIIDVVFRFQGTINKFIGDSIMAIYGAPRTIDHPALRGVATAVEIQRAIGEFNWHRMQQGKPVVNFGIGVHTGEAIAGNIGSARRMEYTVIGRDVNLAQRIEAASREGQILISEHTHQEVSGLVEVNPKEAMFMKGILEPIPLYEVTGVKVDFLDEAPAGNATCAGGEA